MPAVAFKIDYDNLPSLPIPKAPVVDGFSLFASYTTRQETEVYLISGNYVAKFPNANFDNLLKVPDYRKILARQSVRAEVGEEDDQIIIHFGKGVSREEILLCFAAFDREMLESKAALGPP